MLEKNDEREIEQLIIENIEKNIRLSKKIMKKIESDKRISIKVISHQIKKEKSFDMER